MAGIKLNQQFNTIPQSAELGQTIRHLNGEINKLNDMRLALERSNVSGTTVIVQAAANVSGHGGGGGGSSTTLDYRSQAIAVVTTGTSVGFSSNMGGGFSFGILRCYDASGNSVGCRITGLSASGFTATPVKDATLEYFTIVYK